MLRNGPFLTDASGNMQGVKNPNGSELLFGFVAISDAAPVDGVQATLSSNMTAANADLVLTAVNYGSDGNTISVTYVDPAANSSTLDVIVAGKAIKIKLATNSSGTITSTAAAVIAALAASQEAAALVTAASAADNDGTGVVNALAKANLTGGVDVTPGNLVFLTDLSVLYVKTAEQTWGAFYAGTAPA